MRMQSRRKPGTRPKGERRAITVRVPAGDWSVYETASRAAGFDNLSDYVNAILAQHHDIAVPGWMQKPHPQQEVLLRAG